MSLKRPLDSTPLDSRARKRRQCSTPLPATPAVSHISLSTPLKTPHTPYPPRPFDSPGNPFGRKRIKHLTRSLPDPTSFSKHLPLRFQFIRAGSSNSRQGGVFRIVQVPLSYTFTHLRCLIAWLFGGLPGREGSDEHLFEVKKDASIYSHLYKPGQLKSGQTWAKLSSSQNPYSYRMDLFNDDEEDPEVDQLSPETEKKVEKEDGGEESEDGEDEELEDWKWEDEEEFSVGHAWPKGPDLHRAIVYHHSLTTQIHITINQTDIPRRKGRSNTPYVFSARGHVWLSPPPLPRPIFAVPAKKTPSPGTKRKPPPPKVVDEEDAEGDTEPDSGAEDVDDDDDEQAENINREINTDRWNASTKSFAKFLTQYMGSMFPTTKSTPTPSSRAAGPSSSFDPDLEYLSEGDSLLRPSTPGLTRSSSVPSSPVPTLATSSPTRVTSSAKIAPLSESEHPDEGGYVTLNLPALTPFPVKTRPIRKRMKRIEKRMGKLKRGRWLCQNDDKDEDEKEKDELEDDDDDDDENENVAPAENKPTQNELLDWDPFGDEEEL